MGKWLTIIVSSLIMCLSPAFSQSLEKGDLIFDGYYGGPNMWSLLSGLSLNPYAHFIDKTTKLNSVGPIGLRTEYHTGKRVGLGLNVNHGYTKVYGTAVEQTRQGDFQEFNYSMEISRTRFLGTLLLHFGDFKNLDPYFSAGIGWLKQNIKVDSDNPEFTYKPRQLSPPIALRMWELGIRGYFTKNLGGHLAIGMGGGPLLQIGGTVKL